MKQLSKFAMALAASTMAVAPAIAAPNQGNPAASLSVAKSLRVASPAQGASKLRGKNGGLLIALAAGVVIIVAIIIVGSEGSKTPTSP